MISWAWHVVRMVWVIVFIAEAAWVVICGLAMEDGGAE